MISKTKLVVCALLALGFVACSSKQSSPSASGQVLRVHLGDEPEYLDPSLASDNVSHTIIFQLFESLLTIPARDDDPSPGVAKSWKASADLTSFTFYLRKDALWSDGKPVTAGDFAYAWERVLNPLTASQYAFLLYPIKNAKDYNTGALKDPKLLGIKVVDEHTLEVHLEHPTPYFPEMVTQSTYMPIPRWAVEKFGDQWTRPENIVSNGPFTLHERIPYKKIALAKNEKYWDASSVKLPKLEFYPNEDSETALKMYESGQVDIQTYLPTNKIPSLMGRPDFDAHPQLATYYYMLNMRLPLFQDKRVRQALALSIDRKELCEKYLQGINAPTDVLVPSFMHGYKGVQGLGFDPEKARQLLKEAGFDETHPFPVTTISYNTRDLHKLVAQVVQQMWKKNLGIDVKLRNEEWKSFIKTTQSGNFDIARKSWSADYTDPITFLDLFISESDQNEGAWKNPAFDDLIRLSGLETSDKARKKLLRQAEQMLISDIPVIPLLNDTRAQLIRPTVKGYYGNSRDQHPFKNVYIME